jgi:hypothetical protein
MKLSEALLAGDVPLLTNELLKEALERFASELAEEHFLRRVHERNHEKVSEE